MLVKPLLFFVFFLRQFKNTDKDLSFMFTNQYFLAQQR